jgi:hypothetical protein
MAKKKDTLLHHQDGPHAGKVVIHWLRRDDKGPIQLEASRRGKLGVLFPAARFTHGCRPESTTPFIDNGQMTGEPLQVTCYQCSKSLAFKTALERDDDTEEFLERLGKQAAEALVANWRQLETKGA